MRFNSTMMPRFVSCMRETPVSSRGSFNTRRRATLTWLRMPGSANCRRTFQSYNSGATVGYDTFDDAFNAIGDALTATICVNEATTVAASTEYRVESGLNLTVMTKDGTTVIFDGTASNYFLFQGILTARR